MSIVGRNDALIAWLEGAEAFCRARETMVAETRVTLHRYDARLVFESSAGRRVHHSVALTEGNLDQIALGLRQIRSLCRKEAARLRALRERAAGIEERRSDPGVAVLYADIVRDYYAWEDREIRPTAAPTPDAGAALRDDVLIGEPVDVAFVEIGWPDQKVVMDLESMHAAARGFDHVAKALLDHRSAINREFKSVPRRLDDQIGRFIVQRRRLYSGSLERMSTRVQKQARLLVSRARTPGLVDGSFRPGVAPIGWPPPVSWIKPIARLDGAPPSEQFLAAARGSDATMTRLVRTFPVLIRRLPDGWWRPVGWTRDNPPRPLWGDNIPPHLHAVVEQLQDELETAPGRWPTPLPGHSGGASRPTTPAGSIYDYYRAHPEISAALPDGWWDQIAWSMSLPPRPVWGDLNPPERVKQLVDQALRDYHGPPFGTWVAPPTSSNSTLLPQWVGADGGTRVDTRSASGFASWSSYSARRGVLA